MLPSEGDYKMKSLTPQSKWEYLIPGETLSTKALVITEEKCQRQTARAGGRVDLKTALRAGQGRSRVFTSIVQHPIRVLRSLPEDASYCWGEGGEKEDYGLEKWKSNTPDPLHCSPICRTSGKSLHFWDEVLLSLNWVCMITGLPGGSVVKNLPPMQEMQETQVQSLGQEGNGNPLQYSCLGNPMDRGAWWATVHGVAKAGHSYY